MIDFSAFATALETTFQLLAFVGAWFFMACLILFCLASLVALWMHRRLDAAGVFDDDDARDLCMRSDWRGGRRAEPGEIDLIRAATSRVGGSK